MSTEDCCKGEPFMGDPNGMHNLDCPVYQATGDALVAWNANRRSNPTPERITAHTASTSARLARVEVELTEVRAELGHAQRALAASQADLTAARGSIVDLLYIIDAFQVESGADRNACAQTGIDAVRRLREDLAALHAQLLADPGWIVARDGGRSCLDCDREIRRGEAYALVPGEGPDVLRHVHCPDIHTCPAGELSEDLAAGA